MYAQVEIGEIRGVPAELGGDPIAPRHVWVARTGITEALGDAVPDDDEPPPRVPGEQPGRLAFVEAIRIGRFRVMQWLGCHPRRLRRSEMAINRQALGLSTYSWHTCSDV
jgi:hypothetical protein